MNDIITKYDPPPIPDRQFDWQAYHKADFDNYDGAPLTSDSPGASLHAGWGRTEAEALADLARLDEERDEYEDDEELRWRTETGEV